MKAMHHSVHVKKNKTNINENSPRNLKQVDAFFNIKTDARPQIMYPNFFILLCIIKVFFRLNINNNILAYAFQFLL